MKLTTSVSDSSQHLRC